MSTFLPPGRSRTSFPRLYKAWRRGSNYNSRGKMATSNMFWRQQTESCTCVPDCGFLCAPSARPDHLCASTCIHLDLSEAHHSTVTPTAPSTPSSVLRFLTTSSLVLTCPQRVFSRCKRGSLSSGLHWYNVVCTHKSIHRGDHVVLVLVLLRRRVLLRTCRVAMSTRI